MPPTSLPYLYTDRASIEAVLSEAGVRLRLDDDGDGQAAASEAAHLNDLIVEATETINFHLWSRYDPANLAGSNLVWRWATTLAAYALDMRRNHPPSEALAARAEEIEDRLVSIAERGRVLPGVPLRMSCAPSWVNWRIDQRFNWRVIRVERQRSSPSALPQTPDYPSEMYPEM